LLVKEGQRQEESGRKTEKRWLANDNSKKTSDYGWLAALKMGTGL
jgi:hypothetical protein